MIKKRLFTEKQANDGIFRIAYTKEVTQNFTSPYSDKYDYVVDIDNPTFVLLIIEIPMHLTEGDSEIKNSLWWYYNIDGFSEYKDKPFIIEHKKLALKELKAALDIVLKEYDEDEDREVKKNFINLYDAMVFLIQKSIDEGGKVYIWNLEDIEDL